MRSYINSYKFNHKKSFNFYFKKLNCKVFLNAIEKYKKMVFSIIIKLICNKYILKESNINSYTCSYLNLFNFYF